MAKDKFFLVGVKALIENADSEVLLLRAGPNRNPLVKDSFWDIPGGRIKEGQDAIRALMQEIKEETSINKIENISFYASVISNHELLYEDKKVGLVLMIYKVEIRQNSKIKLSDEHVEYEWVNKTEAAKRLSHKYPAEFAQLLN